MRLSIHGVSTVECLVALTVFSLGALGAAGTIALGIRTAATGTHLSRATRIAGEVQEMMEYRLRGPVPC
jgi:Tfp pilus assembly protein PilV